MAKYAKVVIGALAGFGVFAAGRAIAPAPTPIRNRGETSRLPPVARSRTRALPPALSPTRVKRMVVEWGMDPRGFHGRARLWAVAAAQEAKANAQELAAPRVLALAASAPADEQDPDDELDALLERYFASSPTNGHFYTVRPGDTPESVSLATLQQLDLDDPVRKQSILEYVWCFSGCSYNLDRYGSSSTSNSFPEKWQVPGMGQGLRGAFLPRNADAVGLMSNGEPVPRTLNAKAVSTVDDATYQGTIWLPPVCRDALAADGTVTCYPFPWPDGSTSLEPPPELFKAMRRMAS